MLTAILYLTDPDFDADIHGGCLRLFLGCEPATPRGDGDVDPGRRPVPGRLVVFKSRRVPHAVLDTSRRRLALSCWHLAPARRRSRLSVADAASSICSTAWALTPSTRMQSVRVTS